MCWNQYVSINTFVFGIFVLLLVLFNNRYSTYKIDFFNNSYAYLFIMSVISMQFLEFLLWRNIHNITINKLVSTLGLILLALQPFTSLLLIDNIKLRNNLLTIYSIGAFIFLAYTIYTTNIHTTVSKSGHLAWYWTNNRAPLFNTVVLLFYILFLFYPMIYNKYYKAFLLLILFFIFKYYFEKDRSANSLWCFSINSVMLYFLIQILLVLPFNEMRLNN
jgi:hypothetical protein